MRRPPFGIPDRIDLPWDAGQTHLSPSALRDLTALGRWRDDAADGFYDIEGWREAATRRGDLGDPRTLWPSAPEGFRESTAAVLDIAERRVPHLDPASISAVGDAVVTWFEQHSAASLPEQRALEALVDCAMQCVQKLERTILNSATDFPVKDTDGSGAATARSVSVDSANTAANGAAPAAVPLSPVSLGELTNLLVLVGELPETKESQDTGEALVLTPGAVRERVNRGTKSPAYLELQRCQTSEGFDRRVVLDVVRRLAVQRAADALAAQETLRAIEELKAVERAGVVSRSPTPSHKSTRLPTTPGR